MNSPHQELRYNPLKKKPRGMRGKRKKGERGGRRGRGAETGGEGRKERKEEIYVMEAVNRKKKKKPLKSSQGSQVLSWKQKTKDYVSDIIKSLGENVIFKVETYVRETKDGYQKKN